MRKIRHHVAWKVPAKKPKSEPNSLTCTFLHCHTQMLPTPILCNAHWSRVGISMLLSAKSKIVNIFIFSGHSYLTVPVAHKQPPTKCM